MICHLKYIFVCIFLIHQPAGNVFYLGFCSIFSVFTFFFRIRTRSIHSIMYPIWVIFKLTAARLGAFNLKLYTVS